MNFIGAMFDDDEICGVVFNTLVCKYKFEFTHLVAFLTRFGSQL